MSQTGFLKFGELYLLLLGEGYDCIDSDRDLYYGKNGFYIQIGSSEGGNSWIVKLWDDATPPKIYWTMDSLVKRLNESPKLERIK